MRYVVATDGSHTSLRAVRWLVDHLPEAAQAEIFLVYVFPLPEDVETVRKVVDLPHQADDPRVKEIAAPILTRTRETLGQTGAAVHDVTLIGNPAESIVQFAYEMKADLVVVGNRGLSPVKGSDLGSVSRAISHRAPCPVLIVR